MELKAEMCDKSSGSRKRNDSYLYTSALKIPGQLNLCLSCSYGDRLISISCYELSYYDELGRWHVYSHLLLVDTYKYIYRFLTFVTLISIEIT